MVEADGSEDVNDFLLRIRELGDRRDKEDEERTRKLEEEIMEGRKQRQARREERARSISPTKDSPSNPQTPPSGYAISEPLSFSKLTAQSMDPARGSPSPGPDLSLMEQEGDGKAGSVSAKLNSTTNRDVQGTSPRPVALVSTSTPVSASQLSRAGTLSWQQRPGSRGSTDGKNRPLSLIAAQNRAQGQSKEPTKPAATEGNDLSQEQIAQSLGAKDPTWFRQTPDRGQGSAALRKSQTVKTSDTESQEGVRLPGLSKQSTMEPQNFRALPESVQSSAPSQESPAREPEAAEEYDSKSESTSSGVASSSAFPTLSSQRLDPSSGTSSLEWGNGSSTRAPAMSPSQGRISPERMQRPPSPTKGNGGFVQSAMLKRTESVNKRWSAQAGQGTSRGNSIASNRGGLDSSKDAVQGVTLPVHSRNSTYSRDPSPLAASRPGSSHSTDLLANDGFVKPDLPEHVKMSQDSITESQRSSTESLEKVAPQSSSKRWSPSKNPSWLESALSKTDSPKIKPAAPPQQPSWMTDINKAKASRGSVDLGKSTSFQEVSVGGLLRPPPMGATPKSPSLNDISMASPSASAKPTRPNIVGKFNRSDSNPTSPAATSSTDKIGYLSQDTAKDAPTKPPKSPAFDVKGQSGSGSPKPMSTASTSNSPASNKPKPITPPKKDFRSSLQSRKPPTQSAERTEPEFKNVFGKLKRTETKNYVAPDELKSNILRGKAGLAVTDGPKNSERMDEFKQSILKKKEEMKTGGTVADAARKPSGSGVDKTSGSSVPEAIAKRRALGSGSSSFDKTSNPPLPEAITKRRGLGIGSSSVDKTSDSTVPEAIAKRRALGRSRSSQSSVITASEAEPGSPAVTPRQVSEAQKPKVELPEQKSKAPDVEATLPSTTPRQASVGQKPKINAPEKKSSAPGRMQGESTSGGKLADRFVPDLEGILSRGPMPARGAPACAMTASPTELNAENQASSAKESGQASSGTQLTHATKGRARGPKRKLPSSLKPGETSTTPAEATAKRPDLQSPIEEITHDRYASADTQPFAKVSMSLLPNITDRYNNKARTLSPPLPNSSSKVFNGDENKSQSINRSLKIKEQLSPKPKPATPTKSSPAVTREPTPRKPSTSVDRNTTSPTPSNNIKPPIASPTTEAVVEPERENVESVLQAAAQWDSSSKPSPLRPQGPKSPVKLPTRKDEEDAMKQAGLTEQKPQKPIGLGIRSLSDEDTRTMETPTSSRTLPSLPQKSPRSPPLPAKKPDSILNRIISNGSLPTPPQEVSASPLPVFTEAARVLKDFFDDVSIPKSKVDVDAQRVLASRPSFEKEGKIRTLRKETFELTPDGKKNPVPSQQEHILFEENMYLCTHVFGSVPSGKRTTEVYLWCGDGVSSSAIEDAQLFSRNTAKEVDGKLIILNQGKESSNFFEALGGIVITRRGSNSSEAAATYMLCGRRHMGQIAFDEVPLSASSLCSGFPYIVSATSGRLYLWKGRGSGADELGCARLIGMDLGLTGEIEEIEEGAEPAAFWKAFPGGNQKRRTIEVGHWHLKATCDRYATRLFTVELQSHPKSAGLAISFSWARRGSAPSVEDPTECVIKEISPYAQADLSGRGVYVLDAFFEVWVIVGARATSKFPTFRAALLFAQDYAILAASMEDRPFVPAGGVVLQGAPAGVTNSFRKWKEDGKKEGVIALNEALEAAGCDRG